MEMVSSKSFTVSTLIFLTCILYSCLKFRNRCLAFIIHIPLTKATLNSHCLVLSCILFLFPTVLTHQAKFFGFCISFCFVFSIYEYCSYFLLLFACVKQSSLIFDTNRSSLITSVICTR